MLVFPMRSSEAAVVQQRSHPHYDSRVVGQPWRRPQHRAQSRSRPMSMWEEPGCRRQRLVHGASCASGQRAVADRQRRPRSQQHRGDVAGAASQPTVEAPKSAPARQRKVSLSILVPPPAEKRLGGTVGRARRSAARSRKRLPTRRGKSDPKARLTASAEASAGDSVSSTVADGEDDEGGWGFGDSTINCDAETDTDAADSTLPSGWVAYLDPASGNHYYHHAESAVTQWDCPQLEHKPVPTTKSTADPAKAPRRRQSRRGSFWRSTSSSDSSERPISRSRWFSFIRRQSVSKVTEPLRLSAGVTARINSGAARLHRARGLSKSVDGLDCIDDDDYRASDNTREQLATSGARWGLQRMHALSASLNSLDGLDDVTDDAINDEDRDDILTDLMIFDSPGRSSSL